jgi:hypothetical protein
MSRRTNYIDYRPNQRTVINLFNVHHNSVSLFYCLLRQELKKQQEKQEKLITYYKYLCRKQLLERKLLIKIKICKIIKQIKKTYNEGLKDFNRGIKVMHKRLKLLREFKKHLIASKQKWLSDCSEQ